MLGFKGRVGNLFAKKEAAPKPATAEQGTGKTQFADLKSMIEKKNTPISYPAGFSFPLVPPSYQGPVSMLKTGMLSHSWQESWWLLYETRIDCFRTEEHALAHIEYTMPESDKTQSEDKDEETPGQLPPPMQCILIDTKGVQVTFENLEEFGVPFGRGII
jgi:hypothetical protein